MENTQLEKAEQIIEQTSAHLFLTGKAGTGKTTFLKRIVKKSHKNIVVLAPTGIAAINANGVTIHSFLQLDFEPYYPGKTSLKSPKFRKSRLQVIRNIDTIVIDEISMVRADLMDHIDDTLKFVRRSSLPFGGVQMVFIGDLQQLPPVVKNEEWKFLSEYYETPYFFSSKILKSISYATIELTKVYRQDNQAFISLLNDIRENRITDALIKKLNERYIPDFEPDEKMGYVYLMTHVIQADKVNAKKLEAIDKPLFTFKAKVTKDFPPSAFPTNLHLELKEGAQVIFIKNDADHRYVNGSIGRVTKINSKGFSVLLLDEEKKGEKEETIQVEKEKWQNIEYEYDKDTNELTEIVKGEFVQFPVKLAWALTIHKSQGLTFNRAVISMERSFLHGQAYVALSRCRSFEGLALKNPVTASSIIHDRSIERYTLESKEREPDEKCMELLKKNYVYETIFHLFDFEETEKCLNGFQEALQRHCFILYPRGVELFEEERRYFFQKARLIAEKFSVEYKNIIFSSGESDFSERLSERCAKAAAYFDETLSALYRNLPAYLFPLSKEAEEAIVLNRYKELRLALLKSVTLLRFIVEKGFQLNVFQPFARFIASEESLPEIISPKEEKDAAEERKEEKKLPKAAVKESVSAALFEEITTWRRKTAEQEGISCLEVLSQKAIADIVARFPESMEELRDSPFVSRERRERHGEEILEIVRNFIKRNAIQKSLFTEDYSDFFATCREVAQNISKIKSFKKTAREKTKKIDTFEKTLNLFRQGLSPAQIAQERQLSESSVYRHLARFVKSGEIKPEDVLSKEKTESIRRAIQSQGADKGLTPIYNCLEGACSYQEIRLVFEAEKSD